MHPHDPLFDLTARDQRRTRAKAAGLAGFLHSHAATLVSERLTEVNKSFTNVGFVGWVPEIWQPAIGADVVVADSEILDLPANGFDLIVHGLALHHANDPVGQLVQMRAALQPDGLMLAALFGGQTLVELRAAMAAAETEMEGGLSPRVTPMADIAALGDLIGRAGLALPVADSVALTVTYETPLHLLRDLRAMGETNILGARRRSPLRRETLLRMAEIYQTHYGTADGRIPATFEIIFLTGWAPSDTQPKPLRPGSAEVLFAQALEAQKQDPPKC